MHLAKPQRITGLTRASRLQKARIQDHELHEAATIGDSNSNILESTSEKWNFTINLPAARVLTPELGYLHVDTRE